MHEITPKNTYACPICTQSLTSLLYSCFTLTHTHKGTHVCAHTHTLTHLPYIHMHTLTLSFQPHTPHTHTHTHTQTHIICLMSVYPSSNITEIYYQGSCDIAS